MQDLIRLRYSAFVVGVALIAGAGFVGVMAEDAPAHRVTTAESQLAGTLRNPPLQTIVTGSDTTVPFDRVSVSGEGEEADGDSFSPSLSSDGRFIAFSSSASNLVDGDTNGVPDIFVNDAMSGNMSIVSIGLGGRPANGGSFSPALSDDGRYVAFGSSASNLVADDDGFGNDIFLHDRETGETTRVSNPPMPSSDTSPVSVPTPRPPHFSFRRSVSVNADGLYVAFSSPRPDLVDQDSNGVDDVFVYDRDSGTTTRVSVGDGGSEANGLSSSPSISADGRFVAFTSLASNLVPEDTNGTFDVFVHDRQTGETARVSVDDTGKEADGASTDPDISGNGQTVVFWSSAPNLDEDQPFDGPTDVFVHSRETGSTEGLGAAGLYQAAIPSVTDDGRLVVFQANEDPLLSPVPLQSNVFAYDRDRSVTFSITPADGGGSNGSSTMADLSGDGTTVVFLSSSSDLVAGDTNGATDVFSFEMPAEDGQMKGDIDCNGVVDAIDALAILRYVAALPENLPPGCAPISSN